MLPAMSSRPLLIVWHSRTGAAQAMAHAAAEGTAGNGRLVSAQETQPADFTTAAGYLFVCPENLASMSGMMKEMFDRCYYPLLGAIEGRAYAAMIAAGSDGEGARRQIDRIARGWRLRKVADGPTIITKAQTAETILAEKVVAEDDLERCRELGAALAEGLALGIF
jgi:multimeric flavodoxin WrbA